MPSMNQDKLEGELVQKQLNKITSMVYSKFLDMNIQVINLRRKEIELVPKPTELNVGLVGLNTNNRIFSIEEHIQSLNLTAPCMNKLLSSNIEDRKR
jgi:hypothetical protein